MTGGKEIGEGATAVAAKSKKTIPTPDGARARTFHEVEGSRLASRRSDRGKTAIKIMDAAEVLFAGYGFDAVPVRMIMDRAEVRLGLLNYHFGTKEALLEAVVARRANVVDGIRREALNGISSENITIDALVHAYYGSIVPLVIGNDVGWHAYFRLNSLLSQNDNWAPIADKYFVPTSSIFIDRLQKIVPRAPRGRVVRAWVLGVSAAVILFAKNGVVTSNPGTPLVKPTEADFATLMEFISAGLKAVLNDLG